MLKFLKGVAYACAVWTGLGALGGLYIAYETASMTPVERAERAAAQAVMRHEQEAQARRDEIKRQYLRIVAERDNEYMAQRVREANETKK